MARNDYSKPAAWLCWPGKAGDACKTNSDCDQSSQSQTCTKGNN